MIPPRLDTRELDAREREQLKGFFTPADSMNPLANVAHDEAHLRARVNQHNAHNQRVLNTQREFTARVVGDSSQILRIETWTPSPSSSPGAPQLDAMPLDTLAPNWARTAAETSAGATATPAAMRAGNLASSYEAFMVSTHRFAFDERPAEGPSLGGGMGWATPDGYRLKRMEAARRYREQKRRWVQQVSFNVMVARSDMLLAATLTAAQQRRASQ